ncbi:pyridoxine/pyridoxamine 5'-phosphate oxidase [Antrihabitans stalactiti]
MNSYPDTRAWLRSIPMGTLQREGRTAPVAGDPHDVFLEWLEHAVAVGVAEPHVAVLSTVDDEGRPDARVLLLRDVGPGGWWFSGPAFSPKGAQLQANPHAALTFYWGAVGRQVRIAGTVHNDPSAAVRDFLERSETARAVATASRQSAVLVDPDDYSRAIDEVDDPDEVPEHWRAWRLAADAVEFWQAEPGSRHQRWRYRRDGSAWLRDTLWP